MQESVQETGRPLDRRKRITVNGEIAGMGMKVAPDSEVCLDGKLIKKEEKKFFWR